MRYLIIIAALTSLSAYAETPPSEVSAPHMQRANTLAKSYRQCLQDTLGERYINVSVHDPMQLAAEVEKACEPKLVSVNQYLGEMGYAEPVVTRTLVEIKAKADGAAIAYVHRLPAYRF